MRLLNLFLLAFLVALASWPAYAGDSAALDGVPVTGVSYPRVLATGTATGNTAVLYTVPSGKRAALLTVMAYNGGGGSVALQPLIGVRGTDYRIVTASTGTGQVNLVPGFVME